MIVTISAFIQQVLTHVLEEAGYRKDSFLVLADFMKVMYITLYCNSKKISQFQTFVRLSQCALLCTFEPPLNKWNFSSDSWTCKLPKTYSCIY